MNQQNSLKAAIEFLPHVNVMITPPISAENRCSKADFSYLEILLESFSTAIKTFLGLQKSVQYYRRQCQVEVQVLT